MVLLLPPLWLLPFRGAVRVFWHLVLLQGWFCCCVCLNTEHYNVPRSTRALGIVMYIIIPDWDTFFPHAAHPRLGCFFPHASLLQIGTHFPTCGSVLILDWDTFFPPVAQCSLDWDTFSHMLPTLDWDTFFPYVALILDWDIFFSCVVSM